MLADPNTEALKAFVAHNQSLADLSTIAVFVGLLLEIIIIFLFMKDKSLKETILSSLCGVIIAVGVFGEYRYGSRAAQGNSQLQSASELKVADLNKEAGEARKEAGQANERAGKLESANIKLKGALDKAFGDAKFQTEQLRRENLATEAKLEDERRTRLELEASLAPRVLPIIMTGGSGGKTSFDALKPFAGIETTVEYLPDVEAARAAGGILEVVKLAGWKIVGTRARTDINIGYFDGVVVERPPPFLPNILPPSLEDVTADERSQGAAEAIVSLLKSNGWEARWAWSPEQSMSKGTIKVIVGFKALPFFEPQWVKDAERRAAEAEEKSKQRRNQLAIPPNR